MASDVIRCGLVSWNCRASHVFLVTTRQDSMCENKPVICSGKILLPQPPLGKGTCLRQDPKAGFTKGKIKGKVFASRVISAVFTVKTVSTVSRSWGPKGHVPFLRKFQSCG